jgi:[acyl-carrier-protein] S-malonyltransferase
MSKTAFLFPGQGSQAPGMAVSLASASKAARDVLAQVDEALGQKLSALMADGPADELTLTANAQPALFASSLAVVAAISEHSGKSLAEFGDLVAGHSLGEYSALSAVGVFDISTGAKLLRIRGDAMQAAVPVGEGAMAALIGADIELADRVVEKALASGAVQIANDNAPGQVVLSGSLAGVQAAMAIAQEEGLRRVVQLPVSAPFHSELMQPAATAMADALGGASFMTPSLPVMCNVTVALEDNADALRDNLVTQVTGRVRWRESLEAMAASGVTRFVELGTGKVLSGLVKRTLKDVEIISVETLDDIEAHF